MHVGRLRRRVRSVEPIDVAGLSDHKLMFNKRGRDGSGKCNVVAHSTSHVYGVVYRLDLKQMLRLDRVEGSGYGRRRLIVNGLADGRPYRTFLYVAKAGSVDGALVAYDWYRDFVLIGAEQHGLPGQYVAELRQAPVRDDPNQRRSRAKFNIMRTAQTQ